ncbi:sporulation integral membrane protein YlbJ [Clostridium sp. DL1XJH146]
MNIIILITFCFIIYLIYYVAKKYFNSNYNNFIITLMCSFLLISIISNPENSIKAAYDGTILFFQSVFVSLFPFMIIINIMISYGGVDIYSKLLGKIICTPLRLPTCSTIVIIISMLCGYPLGAKYAVNLYENKAIDYNTCERLVTIASNPSPLFVIGVLGVKLFQNKYIGYLLLFSCYMTSVIMSFIIPPKTKLNDPKLCHYTEIKSNNFGYVLKNSINGAISSSLNIGGFIIVFSVLISIIKNNTIIDIVLKYISHFININSTSLKAYILIPIELTNGCSIVNTMNILSNTKLCFISFILGFSTFSIIAQVFSFTGKLNYSFKKYILTKFIHGTICSLVTYIVMQIFNLKQISFVFNPSKSNIIYTPKIYSTQIIVLIALTLPVISKPLFNTISKFFNVRPNN